jgi:hypothetical protein
MSGEGPSPVVADPALQRIVEFGSMHKIALRMLAVGVALIAVGMFLVIMESRDPYPQEIEKLWMIAGVGLLVVIAAVYRLGRQEQRFLQLSPLGVRYRDLGEAIVPWSMIRSVDIVDARYRAGRHSQTVRNATALTVTREFFDQRFDKGGILFSPAIYNAGHFQIGPETVRIVIFHDTLHTPARTIRDAVVARWLAFGPKDAVEEWKKQPQQQESVSPFASLIEGIGGVFGSRMRSGPGRWGRD